MHFLWYYTFVTFVFPLYFGIQKCWRWQFWLKIVEEYGINVFVDTYLKVIFWYKNADVTIFTQKRVWLNRKGYFLWYYVFSSQMRHLCCSLCILVYKNADVDNFYSKSLRSMAKMFYTDYVNKGMAIIMCFVEQKTFSVILRIFLTNAPPLWFPLYFGIQKCWRWQFLLKIVEEYG